MEDPRIERINRTGIADKRRTPPPLTTKDTQKELTISEFMKARFGK